MEAVASSITYFFCLLIYALFRQAKNHLKYFCTKYIRLTKNHVQNEKCQNKVSKFYFSASHNKQLYMWCNVILALKSKFNL